MLEQIYFMQLRSGRMANRRMKVLKIGQNDAILIHIQKSQEIFDTHPQRQHSGMRLEMAV
jgi:hypothetical protein